MSQRAVLPNLPGRWLYVENGIWSARWMRESAGAFLRGEVERATYPATTRVVIRAGTYSGYRFDSGGTVLATRTASLATTSGANIGARAIINGRPYFAVLNGIWAGYWLPESDAAYVAGSLERLKFGALPRLAFAAGTYTGYRYDARGAVIATLKATLLRASGANASAWAVINGRPQYLVANGIWSGYWIAEGPGIALAILP